jgi:ATP-dependent DNA helicase DinG
VIAPADGVLVTSATLRGGEGWPAAEARTGAVHLAGPPRISRPKARSTMPAAPRC